MNGVDVIFSPHFFLAPVSRHTRQVITFHDLSYERFPEFFSLRQRLWHTLQMRPRWQARHADAIIAVSDSTQRDLEKIYGIATQKIHRIYSGVAPMVAYPTQEDIHYYRAEHHLTDRYILALGTLEPRKNILGLIQAFASLKLTESLSDVRLVIAGSGGWLNQDIFQFVQKSGLQDSIRFLDQVTDSDRPLLYAGAEVFVYPSFFEGFGFPPLEAMQCGTPVVASHVASLPEVLEDAALLIDPHNSSDIARAITSVLEDQTLRNELIGRGVKQAASFSWDKSARQTLDLLLAVARK